MDNRMSAHDFSRLSSFDFEELVCDLLQAEWRTRLEIFTPGPDSGIDLRAFVDSTKETIIQCKHVPGSTFAQLLSHLRREELPKVKVLGPARYVLIVSIGLTPENKRTLTKLFHPYLRRQTDILGRTEINSLLRRHKNVETNNFKLWLTSTAVLQRVLHNAQHCQTEFEVERVRRKLPLFVQNEAFPRAQKILADSRIVVISGEPGIGKTTLADMLLFAHLEQGFEPVVVQSGIDEAKRLFSRNSKQVFYFDDFLGETFLHDRPDLLTKNQDAALISFMEGVRSSKASRFILTTREHILKKALNASERIGSSSILDHRCVLELSDYSFGQKARILYNHLYFSDLPGAYKLAVLKDEFYFSVIRHRNFNPRLIEWLSGYVRVKTVTPDDYRDHIRQLLDSPERIWSHAFEEQITEAARSVLFSLCAASYGLEIIDLELVWQSLHQHKSTKYNFSTSARDFRRALSDLEGSFIKIDGQRIDFINPSIRDFVENLFRSHKEHVLDIVESAVRFSQITGFRDLDEEKSSPALKEVLAPSDEVVAALQRVMNSPHVRWTVNTDGSYTGTYVDTTPEARVRLLVKWAEETKSRDLLKSIDFAQLNLENYWKQLVPNVAPVIGILEELEKSPWVYANGGAALHRLLLDKIFGHLDRAVNYEWNAMLTYRGKTKHWTDQDHVSVKEALREYRLRGVMTEFEECEDVDQLEGLKDSLRDMQRRHRVSFRSILKKLDEDIKRRRRTEDAEEDDDFQPVTSAVKKHEPDNEAEVRRLFGSLIA
jgi:hypothetical protein